jgi:hypothetical protein
MGYFTALSILGLKYHREIPDGQRKISKGEVTRLTQTIFFD